MRKATSMGNIHPLQRLRRAASPSPTPSRSSLRPPSRPSAPPSRVSSPLSSNPEHASRVGWSFEHISITPHNKENTTGLPDHLKTGVERLSGLSLDDTHVHYNSPKPASLHALAYTQGTEIYVGPGQERHLAHEAWHVVQQKQERVQPTVQAKGAAINDDRGLEREADVMGARAHTEGDSAHRREEEGHRHFPDRSNDYTDRSQTIQRFTRATPAGAVIQMAREWTGLDADLYQEKDGKFYKFNINTQSWVQELPPERELISQYFGGTVRAEAPPLTIADFVGWHVKAVDQKVLDTKPPYLQGIVGVWDTSLAKTGHALGSGSADTRMNQYGDGIYVVNPKGSPKDYQHYYQPSIVYQVYAMKGVKFDKDGDNMQTVFKDPKQFSQLCFVRDAELPSVKQEMAEKQQKNIMEQLTAPPPIINASTNINEIPKNAQGQRNYSVF